MKPADIWGAMAALGRSCGLAGCGSVMTDSIEFANPVAHVLTSPRVPS